MNKLYAWYSQKAYDRFGGSNYRGLDGSTVTVTEVGQLPEPLSKWDDLCSLGEVEDEYLGHVGPRDPVDFLRFP
jgi:hypothetical protein